MLRKAASLVEPQQLQAVGPGTMIRWQCRYAETLAYWLLARDFELIEILDVVIIDASEHVREPSLRIGVI